MFAPHQKSIADTLNMADCLVVIVGEGNDGAVCDGLLSIIDGFSDEGCIRSSRYGMNNVEIFHTEFLVSVQQMSVPLKWRGTDVCQTDAEFLCINEHLLLQFSLHVFHYRLPQVRHIFYDETYCCKASRTRSMKHLTELIQLDDVISDEELAKAKANVYHNHIAMHFYSSVSSFGVSEPMLQYSKKTLRLPRFTSLMIVTNHNPCQRNKYCLCIRSYVHIAERRTTFRVDNTMGYLIQ